MTQGVPFLFTPLQPKLQPSRFSALQQKHSVLKSFLSNTVVFTRQLTEAMAELYLQELRYQIGEDPDPWIAKLQRVQEAFGYDDAKMVLLVETCVQKPVREFVRQFSRTSRVQEVYAGFRRLHELCKRVDSERAFKWAMLHVGCEGKHNPRNVVPDKKASSSSSSSSESEEEISMTGETEVLRFPENSFPIHCGYGDFCVNDVLKFDQTLVYNNVSLKEGTVGKAYKRTIVGRVAHEAEGVEVTPATRKSTTRMSESLSQSDEEPTYTIEVYWSRGVKPVSTSEPFVIKAHSLELLKPVRQRWGNEQNRVHEMERKQSKLGSARAKSRALQTGCRRLSAPNRRSEIC